MARGSKQATTAATSAQNLSNNLQGQSNALYGEVAPILESEAAHPVGLNPTEKANINTAAQQSAGGSMASAVGQGALLASRTHNAGTADAAIQESARNAGQQASKAAVGTEIQDAAMKERQRQSAIGGLSGLYGESLGGSVGALGVVPQAVNANTNASNASWDWAKYLLDPAMAAAGSGAGMAAGCWIAEAIYGIDDPRTHLVRAWLNGPFKKTAIGAAVMWLYLRIGRKVASMVRLSRIVESILRPVFDLALERAVIDANR